MIFPFKALYWVVIFVLALLAVVYYWILLKEAPTKTHTALWQCVAVDIVDENPVWECKSRP